jgi:hypothetical protein
LEINWISIDYQFSGIQQLFGIRVVEDCRSKIYYMILEADSKKISIFTISQSQSYKRFKVESF